MRLSRTKPYSDTPGAMKYWFSRHIQLRIYASAYTTLLIAFGMEISTPDYSLSTTILEYVKHHTDIVRLLDYTKIFSDIDTQIASTQLMGPAREGEIGVSGETAFKYKLALFALVWWLVNAYLTSHDPLSDRVYIRDYNKGGKHRKYRFPLNILDEVHLYPKIAPSNKLPLEVCEKCKTSCPNRIGKDDHKRTDRWEEFIRALPLKFVDKHMKVFHACRRIYYIRCGMLIAAVVIIPIYIIVRIAELYLSLPVNINLGVFFYSLSLLLAIVALKVIFSIGRDYTYGFWRQYQESIEAIFRSPIFSQKYAEIICKQHVFTANRQNTNNNSIIKYSFNDAELQTITLLNEYMNMIVSRKIQHLVSNKRSNSNVSVVMLRIIRYIADFYSYIYRNEYSFKVYVFVHKTNTDYLVPALAMPHYIEFMERGDDFFKEYFSRNSISIVSRAFETRVLQTCNEEENIPCLNDLHQKSCSSIIAFPISIEPNIYNDLSKLNETIEPTIGVLCLTSDSSVPFSVENRAMNELILDSFALRINYEYIARTVADIRGAGNENKI